MSDNLLSSRKIQKRKYSRKGCKECKRRKIKCDEAVPFCNNCSRLSKTCVYELMHGGGDAKEKRKPKDELRMRHYTQTATKTPIETPPMVQPPFPHSHESSPDGVRGHLLPNGMISGGANNNHQSSPDTHPIGANPHPIGLNPHPMAPMGPLPGMGMLPSPATGPLGMLPSPVGPRMMPSPGTLVMTPPEHMSMSPGTLTTVEMQMLFDEASVLVHDMNHLIGEDLLESFVPAPQMVNVTPNQNANKTLVGMNASPMSNDSEERSYFKTDDFFELMHEDAYVSPSGIQEHLVFSNLELIDQCIVENSLEEPHITYLRTVTTTDILYHLYPFASLIELNEVVKLLLTYSGKCPYLLSSLLAISATFQFNQTGKVSHDRARRKYIAVCFQALSDAFTENSESKNTAFLSNNIEKLLLTVLVLTSYFTATTCMLFNNIVNSWKVHLRGARDLLMNYSKITKSANPARFMSGGLALAKCWFFALESSAALFLPLGGSVLISKTDRSITGEEMCKREPTILEGQDNIFADSGVFDRDVHPEYHDALSRVNMLCLSPTLTDFNLFYGYTSRYVKVILHVCSVIDTMRVNGLQKCPSLWLFHLIKLTDDALEEQIVPQVLEATFEVPITSVGHPEYTGSDKVEFRQACLVSDVDDAGNKRYYSWFDASQRLHLNYTILWTLVSPGFMQLPRTHAYVQEIIHMMFVGCFFIKSKSLPRYLKEKDTVVVESDNFYLSLTTFDMRCVMVQSIFRLLAGLVVEDEYFERIELFFMGLVKLGNGSSLNSLDIVARFKENRKSKREEFPGEVDDEIYEYYERSIDIPFA